MSIRMIERVYNLGAVDAVAYRYIYFVFNVSRTPVSLASSMSPTGFVQQDAGVLLSGTVGEVIPLPNVLAFEVLNRVVARDEFHGLAFESFGEAPELVRIVLESPEHVWVSIAKDRPCLDTIDLKVARETGFAAQYIPGPAEYMLELEIALESVAPDKSDASNFFARFDHLTHSLLGASSTTITAVESVSAMAQERLDARLAEHLCNPNNYTRYKFSQTQIEDLQHIADLFVECAAMYLGPLHGHLPPTHPNDQYKAAAAVGIDLGRFETAFEQFADGQLRLQLQPSGMWSTQPSSGFYFFFAELALLAAEAGLNGALWTALANVMIRTHEVYAARYGPQEDPRPGRTMDSYTVCQYRKDCELRKPSATRIANARTTYSTKTTLESLAKACAENSERLLH